MLPGIASPAVIWVSQVCCLFSASLLQSRSLFRCWSFATDTVTVATVSSWGLSGLTFSFYRRFGNDARFSLVLEAIALALNLNDMTVVKQPVEECRRRKGMVT